MAPTTQRGIRLFTNGVGSQNVTNTIIQHVWVHGFTVAGISLAQSFATNLIGVRSNANGNGLLLEGDSTHFTKPIGQVFNGTVTVTGGDYSGNMTGLYLDDYATEFSVRGAVIEANLGCGVQMLPPYVGITIENNHFEDNAITTDCEDIRSGIPRRAPIPTTGLAAGWLLETTFSPGRPPAHLLGSINIKSSFAPEITGNSNQSSPGPGCPGSSPCAFRRRAQHYYAGRRHAGESVNDNARFNVQNDAGAPLFLYPANIHENAFVYSTDITNGRWRHNSSVVLDNGTCAGCSAADLVSERCLDLEAAVGGALGDPRLQPTLARRSGRIRATIYPPGSGFDLDAGSGTVFISVATPKASYTRLAASINPFAPILIRTGGGFGRGSRCLRRTRPRQLSDIPFMPTPDPLRPART